MTGYPRWAVDRINRHLVHAVLRPGTLWKCGPATIALVHEQERVLLAARRRDAYARARKARA